MAGEGQRNVLLAILIGSLLLSFFAIGASAYTWGRNDAPTMPQLVVTLAPRADDPLPLDVMSTRADLRTLSTTLDAAYHMGSASVPLTDEQATLVEGYLVGKAVRAGREDVPSTIEWRGETFRIELR